MLDKVKKLYKFLNSKKQKNKKEVWALNMHTFFNIMV